ncbi:MAG: hypothetical protein AAF414_11700 [Pseudomonadota bacterium]
MKRIVLTSISFVALGSSAAMAQPNTNGNADLGSLSVHTITSAAVNNAAGAVVNTDSFSSGVMGSVGHYGTPSERFDPAGPVLDGVFDRYDIRLEWQGDFSCGFSFEDVPPGCSSE